MKDYPITFLIDGKEVGSSTLTATGKTLLTHAAEDEFYAILRKNEKSLLEEAEMEERDDFMDVLSPMQENVLHEKFMEVYTGSKEDYEDEFERWMEDLTLDELKDILK